MSFFNRWKSYKNSRRTNKMNANKITRNNKKNNSSYNSKWYEDKKYYDTLMNKCNRGQSLSYNERNWLEYNSHKFDI